MAEATRAGSRLAGHALVEALIAQGIGIVFGVPGESYLAVLDGFYEHRESIRFVACRHEGGAAFMAEAQGKLSGWPGVCFVTRGPGATNAAIGIHTAFQDSTPMVVFVGQVAADQRDREAFQELDYRQVFGPGTLGMAKWVGEVHDPDRLPEYVSRAFHTAMQGRPGPVVLALPEDMLTASTAAPVLPRAEPAQSAPTASALQRLAQMLAQAQRPLVIAGGPLWTADSVRGLQSFAERWQLPVACGFRYQDTFDNRHALYAGDVGIGINPQLAECVKQADLIFALGVRLGEMTTGGYTLLAAPQPVQRLVHWHPGAEELGRVYRADLAILASLAQAGQALGSLVPPHAPESRPWATWQRSARAAYEANQQAPATAPMDMAEVVKTIARVAPPHTVYTNGAGNYSAWLHRFLPYVGLQHHGRTQLAPTAGAMGYGVPAAVAASLLYPERAVVNIAGDGDFLMTGQEMATAMAHRAGAQAPLVSVVVDNGSYGTIRMHQERHYPERVSATALHNPDFAELAHAYGWHGVRVERTDQFEAAFAQALKNRAPTLLHLVLDTEVISPRATLSQLRAAARS
jgi:acetolactate synthase I/II/III large subunit